MQKESEEPGDLMDSAIVQQAAGVIEVLRNVAEKMQKESEEPGDLMDLAIVQQGVKEHMIPCRLCKHYQYELCMEGHKPTDDEFFCKDSKRDPKRELKRESKGD